MTELIKEDDAYGMNEKFNKEEFWKNKQILEM
jgi:hypothetical protein